MTRASRYTVVVGWKMIEDQGYETAMREYLAQPARKLTKTGAKYPRRVELYSPHGGRPRSTRAPSKARETSRIAGEASSGEEDLRC